MAVYSYNPGIWEMEARESEFIFGYLGSSRQVILRYMGPLKNIKAKSERNLHFVIVKASNHLLILYLKN